MTIFNDTMPACFLDGIVRVTSMDPIPVPPFQSLGDLSLERVFPVLFS
jgi:hypothetical protein